MQKIQTLPSEKLDFRFLFVPTLTGAVSHQDFSGSAPEFPSYNVQLVLEMPYDKNGRPMLERANIYRLSYDQALTFESVVLSKESITEEEA